MSKRFIFLSVLLCLLITLTTGCWGSKEIDEAGYAIALGLDTGPGQNLIISALIDNPGVTSGLGGNESAFTPGQMRVFTVEAPTIFSGINLINTVLENQIELSHLKMVIFGETLAKQDIEPYTDVLTRWRKFRRTFYIAVAQGEAKAVIESIVPPAGYNGAEFIENMFTSQAYVGYTPENQMLHFYNALKAKGEDPIAPLVAPRISKYNLTANQEKQLMTGTTDFNTDTGDPGNYTAGETPVSGDSSLQFMGTAIFRRGKMMDKLTGNETLALKALRGELTRAFISVPDPDLPNKLMQLELTQIHQPRIKVFRIKDQLRVKVHLSLLDDTVGIESNRQYETPQNISRIQQTVTKWVKSECLNVFQKAQASGCDIFGFGNYARWLVPDWPSWQRWDWNSDFKNLKLDLSVTTRVDRTGLIIKKNAVRGD
jgi:spore germination protein KC